MVDWTDTQQNIDNAEKRGGMFLQLKEDGEAAVVVFMGEPHTDMVHWNNTEQKTVGCAGDGCALCKQRSATVKISMNVGELMDDGSFVVKIWKGGVRFWRAAMKRDQKKPFSDNLYEIARDGKGVDTTYDINHERELTEEEKSSLKFLELKDLANPFGDDTETPF